ncbi:hypothetical protein [Amazonocrinis nigriterrae]|nr:hypothetical protein [Amazonocrinis nigriterrae]
MPKLFFEVNLGASHVVRQLGSQRDRRNRTPYPRSPLSSNN